MLRKKDWLTSFAIKSYFQIRDVFLANLPKNRLSKKMKNSTADNVFFRSYYFNLAGSSLLALIVTFFVANSNLGFEIKSAIFLAIVIVYFVAFYAFQKRHTDNLQIEAESRISELVFNSEVENRLLALEEASEFFGASLEFPDMFRLIASRINELMPFAACALVLADEKKTNLKTVCAVGENARFLLNFETDFDKGLAGKTFVGQTARHEEKLLSDKFVLPEAALTNLESGLAVPLFQDGDVFGVLTLYGNTKINFNARSIELIEAVATRVAPLFLSSMAFERSVSNALTDALTKLPNERAFYLVLENQIAESERNRDARPLTVLTIDIKNFTELNQKFGHAAGDAILVFTANIIKGQLRQMDFLARSQSDEFLAVLPTASEDIALEIIERIEKAFVSNPYKISEQEKNHLQLNFGAATFWKDGETASRLLQHAHLRKQQTKTGHSNQVIWFPKEYVN